MNRYVSCMKCRENKIALERSDYSHGLNLHCLEYKKRYIDIGDEEPVSIPCMECRENNIALARSD
jgi:predicted nucleic-acid-binding Zn-ribbon protein